MEVEQGKGARKRSKEEEQGRGARKRSKEEPFQLYMETPHILVF